MPALPKLLLRILTFLRLIQDYDASRWTVGIAVVKAAVVGAALQQGVISEGQLPALMADGANLHKARDLTSSPKC